MIISQNVRCPLSPDKAARRPAFRCITILALCVLALSGSTLARADTGIVVYGSKGMDQRRTNSGHISLIVTDLCASGIDQVRECRVGETPGVIITAYSNLASDYGKAVFVVPMLDHFTATKDPALIPVLSSSASLRAAQIEYWRRYLRPYFPPMTQERYTEIRNEMEHFDAGRTMRRLLSMEFIGSIFGAHKTQDATEPIALIDPATRELIPNGRWREAVGTEQMRSAVVLTAPSSVQQELRLVHYLEGPQSRTFNILSENCSDFIEGGLLAVYGDTGLRFRPRPLDLADVWITSPLFVATGFVSYAKKNVIPLQVVFLPITAGTRRSHFSVTSISRGALVPAPSQGMIAFGVKSSVNVLNPFLGLTTFAVDQLSRLVNLPRLIHDCSGGDLLSLGTSSKACSGSGFDQRDRIRVFGTRSCWKHKQGTFQKLASQAWEVGLLNQNEKNLILKRGQPFLLPRLYEHAVADNNQEQSLVSGMQTCVQPGCSSGNLLVKVALPSKPALDDAVPGRPQIRGMAESSEPILRETAFKLMLSVINFDLSSEPTERRTVQAFDKDWQLFVHVADKNQLSVAGAAADKTLEACSCRSFDTGAEAKDALQEARGFPQRVMRAERELVAGPVR